MSDQKKSRVASSMSGEQRTLPDFEDPPVVETVLGVEFAALQGWSIPHFGLLWHQFKSEYPHFEVQQPLPKDIDFEVGLELRPANSPRISVSAIPSFRCWFFDESRTKLIQVQNDRFLHNWIKTGPGEKYPHYENIRPEFENEWVRFCEFLTAQHIPWPSMLQCEVTYVNHLERGKGWSNFADLQDVVSVWSGRTSGSFLPHADAVIFNIRFPMANSRGVLTVAMEPAIRRTDQKEVIQLRLTAQGRPESEKVDDILRWLDLGREWIVRGFTDFTTPKMHALWRRSI